MTVMIHLSVMGSINASTAVPAGTPKAAPIAITKTSRRLAPCHARGIIPIVAKPSTTRSTGETNFGPMIAPPSGMKMSAAPKPEKPRANPAMKAAATSA